MSTEQPRPKIVNWKWYFLGIALVAAALITWLLLFIAQQRENQVTLEQLKAARETWAAKGAKDYLLLYTVHRGGDASKDRFFVEVRGGKVQSVILNGAERLGEDKFPYSSMEGLFNDIEMFLKRDAQPDSPKTFCRAWFAKEDGHLITFQRQVIGERERVEIKVEEFKPAAAK